MPLIAPDLAMTAAEAATLLDERVVIPTDDALFHVVGTGAVSCLQGLLTNDVVKPADMHAVWGALLTPKGMIITDAWVLRDGDDCWVAVPDRARQTVRELFIRTMPPRLAKVTDWSDTLQLIATHGGIPALEKMFELSGDAPCSALVIAARDGAATLFDDEWKTLPAEALDVAKVLLGWPVLGREIDERTLPQEVRFDELGGVKYDKGCYTGQETVARLHFRGHANRRMIGVTWPGGDGPTSRDVIHEEKVVGTLRTVLRLGSRTMATAVLRREMLHGMTVQVGESSALVTDFPLPID